ncbi:hypothetical protein MY1884_009429 [Beauveria asiatica]
MLPRLGAGGRLIYVGAGNSGRVTQMDCAEIPVTFSADAAQFRAVVAGGPRAVWEAVEGAEDAREDGEAQMDTLRLSTRDTVIGISASGRTPFVVGALQRAMSCAGALTAAVTNVQPSEVARLGVDYCVTALVGPEFVTGSTRLKAGSCAKHILNMISTCAMIRLGKTYQGLMVDVRISVADDNDIYELKIEEKLPSSKYLDLIKKDEKDLTEADRRALSEIAAVFSL